MSRLLFVLHDACFRRHLPGATIAASFLVSVTVTFACARVVAVEYDRNASQLIERFEAEYPAAALKLSKATSSVRCKGRYFAPYLPPNKDRQSKEKVWVSFDLIEVGPSLRWQFKYELPDSPTHVRVVGPDGAFRVESRQFNNFQLADITDEPIGEEKLFTDVLARRFIHAATWLWDFRDLIVSFQAGVLTLEDAWPNESNPEWITYRVTFKNPSKPDVVGKGTITLSPNESWAIREWEYEMPYVVPLKMKMTVNVENVPDLGIIPSDGIFQSTIKRKNEDWRELERYVFEFQSITNHRYDKSDFTLASFGLVDPRPNRYSLVILNVAFIGVLIVVIAIRATMKYAKR